MPGLCCLSFAPLGGGGTVVPLLVSWNQRSSAWPWPWLTLRESDSAPALASVVGFTPMCSYVWHLALHLASWLEAGAHLGSHLCPCLLKSSFWSLWWAEWWPSKMSLPSPPGWEYVTLYGKRAFADVSKLRILRWEHPGGLDVITRVLPFKGRREGRVRGIGGVTPEAETGVIHFEDEGWVKVECKWPLDAEKGTRISPSIQNEPALPTLGL